MLSTQIDVFNEGMALDQEATEEGMDITNHREVFGAVYTRVRSLLLMANCYAVILCRLLVLQMLYHFYTSYNI